MWSSEWGVLIGIFPFLTLGTLHFRHSTLSLLMADLEKTVEIIFSGTDTVSKTMQTVTGSLDRFAAKTQRVTQPLADVAAGVLKTEAALGALAAGGLAYAYAKSIEFETAIIDLKKVLGDEIELLDQARENAFELSNEYGVAAANVLKSTAAFKQAGFTISDSMLLTEAALKLVAASELDAAEASEVLVSSLKGFAAPASEVNRLMDIWNHTSSIYATDVEQLAVGMSKLSPIAKLMGMSFEETAGVLTPIIEVFRSGDEAAIALKTGLLKLISDTKPVKDALAALGVSQKDLNGNLRSGKDILFDVSDAFTTLDENQKLAFASQLVGKQQAGRLVTVFDNLGKVTEIVDENMKNAAGSINNEVVLALASGEVAVDRFKVGFTNMAIAVGERFQDSATRAIAGATDIENTLQELAKSGAFDELLGVVEDMSGDIGDLFTGIARAMPEALEKVDWSAFTGSLEGVLDEIGDLFDAMFGDVDLTTPEGVAKVMQKIIDAGTALNNVVSGLLDAWEPFIRGLSEGIDTFSQGGADVQEFVGKILGFGQAINKIAGAVGPLTSGLHSLSGAFVAIAGVQAGKTLLSFGGSATSVMTNIKGLPNAINAVIGSTAGKAGMLGLAAAAGYAAGTIIHDNVPAVRKGAAAVIEWTDKIFNWTGTQKSATQTLRENEAFLNAQKIALSRVKDETIELDAAVDGLEGAEVEIDADIDPFERNLAIVNDKMAEYTYEEAIKTLTIDNREALDTIQQTQGALDSMGMDPDAFDDIDDFIGQIEDELEKDRIALGVEVDDKDLDKAKNKVKKTFSSANMGPIGLEFDAGSGLGGIHDQVTSQFKDKPIPMEDLFDPSGLADLFDALDNADSLRARQQVEKAINQQLTIQRDLANIQKAAAKQMWDAAYVMKQTGEADGGTIEIEAQGLEPEMEAFMWKLLKKIQVRANKSGAEFLLAAT